MADDRPADTEIDAITRLRREYDDKIATVLARVNRRPVGTIEPVLRTSAPPGTLLCQGQAVLRATYPDLWAWAQAVGAVTGGLFGVGDGSTTFTLPDMRGRMPIGVGTLGSDTYVLGSTGGSARHTLTAAELPAHTHGSAGSHAGHNAGAIDDISGGAPYSVAASTQNSLGSHTHASVGGDDAHENRPPYVAVSWVIYT